MQIQPPIIDVARSDWYPRRVIAIDGSNIVHRVNNGFPGRGSRVIDDIRGRCQTSFTGRD